MDTITIGRKLDENDNPVPKSGLKIDPNGKVANKLRDRKGPLVSNPISREWVTELVSVEETDGEYLSALYIIAGEGPPPHYHVGFEESFKVLKGELTIEEGDTSHHLSPGEKYTIPPETVHKPRYEGDDFAAAIGSVRPASKTMDLLMTLFGLTHEEKVDENGQPGFMQGMVMTDGFADDTVFVSPPPAVTKPLSFILAPAGRMLGYNATYEKYKTIEFWEKHIEQPKL